MEVLVFKTNLSSERKIRDVRSQLDTHPHISQWNVDLHDRDKVLRIETTGAAGIEVLLIVTRAGYFCEELE